MRASGEERLGKITWNQLIQVCVLARHKLWRFFFSKTLLTTGIAPACYLKTIYNFPEKSEMPKFIILVKSRLMFVLISALSGVEMKDYQRSEQAHFFILRLCGSISRSRLRCLCLCSNGRLRLVFRRSLELVGSSRTDSFPEQRLRLNTVSSILLLVGCFSKLADESRLEQ